MCVLHVLHEGLPTEEQLVAYRTGRGVGTTDQGSVLLQHRDTEL